MSQMNLTEVQNYLEKTGKKIGEQASKGNKKALEIMKIYKMLYDCPGDPGAQGILCELVKDWSDQYNLYYEKN